LTRGAAPGTSTRRKSGAKARSESMSKGRIISSAPAARSFYAYYLGSFTGRYA
jgi:hypothetical protein